MTDRAEKKSKRRRRDRERCNDDGGAARGSGVDYSKVADRHVDDDRFEKHRQHTGTGSTPSAAADAVRGGTAPLASQSKVSSQMAAVMRIMAGKEERTIAEKLADSNRPTWDQYKKDNEDKLDITGLDQKKMEAYRKELDEQREKLLTRGTNHRGERDDRKSKKKRKKRYRHHDDNSTASNSSGNFSGDESRKSRKRKKHKKRMSKHDRKRTSRQCDSDGYASDFDGGRKKSSRHKRKNNRKGRNAENGSSSGDSYRLSSFFTKGSDGDSK